MLSRQPQNATLLSNQTLTISCQVTAGAPFPEVVWTRDGAPVNLTERVHLQQYSASLQFESLELGDSGEYACYMENVNGSAQSDSGFITILGNSREFSCIKPINMLYSMLFKAYCWFCFSEWTCFNGIQSPHETDVDCGGEFCDPCNITQVMRIVWLSRMIKY